MYLSYNVFIDFSLIVKAATLIFISGRGSAISYGSPGGTFLLITYHLLLTTYYLLLITYYFSLITYHLLLTTYYLLLIVSCITPITAGNSIVHSL